MVCPCPVNVLACLLAAPLILGGDVRTLSPGDLAIVSNPKLIRIDQDPAGIQGKCIRGCQTNFNHEAWAKDSVANFTAKNSAARQVFMLPQHASMTGLRLAVFSQYSQWQPLVAEVEFQTSDGTWRKNEDGCAAPSKDSVTAASGAVAGPGGGLACAAADGNLSTSWDAKSDMAGRYWIEFGFGGENITLKAIAISGAENSGQLL
jgi:hypothetical protein